MKISLPWRAVYLILIMAAAYVCYVPVHELGHALAAIICGVPVFGITVYWAGAWFEGYTLVGLGHTVPVFIGGYLLTTLIGILAARLVNLYAGVYITGATLIEIVQVPLSADASVIIQHGGLMLLVALAAFNALALSLESGAVLWQRGEVEDPRLLTVFGKTIRNIEQVA